MKKLMGLMVLLAALAQSVNSYAETVTMRWTFDVEREPLISGFVVQTVDMSPEGDKPRKLIVWTGTATEREATFAVPSLYSRVTPFYLTVTYLDRHRVITGPYYFVEYAGGAITAVVESP